jgi:hypothetical protein
VENEALLVKNVDEPINYYYFMIWNNNNQNVLKEIIKGKLLKKEIIFNFDNIIYQSPCKIQNNLDKIIFNFDNVIIQSPCNIQSNFDKIVNKHIYFPENTWNNIKDFAGIYNFNIDWNIPSIELKKTIKKIFEIGYSPNYIWRNINNFNISKQRILENFDRILHISEYVDKEIFYIGRKVIYCSSIIYKNYDFAIITNTTKKYITLTLYLTGSYDLLYTDKYGFDKDDIRNITGRIIYRGNTAYSSIKISIKDKYKIILNGDMNNIECS